eukprot:TRINITY_DN22887_c0_g1_i3.p1 TRINITY_DN22887_c0_g1~~TRINITY_DN22887_c0_g1_i3.p1  ORF type:complete len:112 (-),score=8.68 TRINITY_DN22887_c0_g1_i3:409-720(-)
MIRRPPRSTHCISSAASDVYKRQLYVAIGRQSFRSMLAFCFAFSVLLSFRFIYPFKINNSDEFHFGERRLFRAVNGFDFMFFKGFLLCWWICICIIFGFRLFL